VGLDDSAGPQNRRSSRVAQSRRDSENSLVDETVIGPLGSRPPLSSTIFLRTDCADINCTCTGATLRGNIAGDSCSLCLSQIFHALEWKTLHMHTGFFPLYISPIILTNTRLALFNCSVLNLCTAALSRTFADSEGASSKWKLTSPPTSTTSFNSVTCPRIERGYRCAGISTPQLELSAHTHRAAGLALFAP
jgi:hypothetical protein